MAQKPFHTDAATADILDRRNHAARLDRIEQRNTLSAQLGDLRDAVGEADTGAQKKTARDAVKAFKAAHPELAGNK